MGATIINIIYQTMKSEEKSLRENDLETEGRRFLRAAGRFEKRKQGAWSIEQQKKYIIFIEKYKYELQHKQKRKDNKIFKNMSNFIGSRDGIQCRSHHMKLLRTHAKIKRIIDHFKKKFKDQLDGTLPQDLQCSNKQSSNASFDNPLNKFCPNPMVKLEQTNKNQDICIVEMPILMNPAFWDENGVTWNFQNNMFHPYWNLWPTYGFCSFSSPQS